MSNDVYCAKWKDCFISGDLYLTTFSAKDNCEGDLAITCVDVDGDMAYVDSEGSSPSTSSCFLGLSSI